MRHDRIARLVRQPGCIAIRTAAMTSPPSEPIRVRPRISSAPTDRYKALRFVGRRNTLRIGSRPTPTAIP